jgi:nucleoside-diphosphate-sugar epimerase
VPNKLGIESVLITGASGKLGRAIAAAFVAAGCRVRALQHRTPVAIDGVEIVPGSISDAATVEQAVAGMDAVCQLATTKEDPETYFDVSLRGTLNLLEAVRRERRVKQFLLSGGDAAMGIWFYPQPIPIHEAMPLRAYPGRYAFTKVMEEVMCQQHAIQYGLPYTCLRASWVFTGDDILKHLSLTRAVDPDRPAVSSWDEFLADEHRRLIARGEDRVPILVNRDRVPYRRHIVHLEDVVQAWLLALGNPVAVGQTFHIAAPSAFSYDQAAGYLSQRTGVPTTELVVPDCHSFEIDITRARSMLGYRPKYDIYGIIDAALGEGDTARPA